MGIDLEYIDGQTPLDEDEKSGLLIKSIATRGELDEFEQQNIESAIQWTMNRNFKKENIFAEEFARQLHKKMYGNVWKWAGEFRKTEKNIGVDPVKIGVSLKQLNDDILFWVENRTFSDEEIAIRYNHSIVSIHCFANGNGRHSRLMADLIITKIFSKEVFDWGQSSLSNSSEIRSSYLNALMEADNGNIEPLIDFSKTNRGREK